MAHSSSTRRRIPAVRTVIFDFHMGILTLLVLLGMLFSLSESGDLGIVKFIRNALAFQKLAFSDIIRESENVKF